MAEIELLTLANHAEAVNGLLYLSGAGWDVVTRNYPAGGQPQPHHFGIAVSIVVPWHETNQVHALRLRIEDEDGGSLWAVDGNLEVGRPTGKPPGSDVRAVLALGVNVNFARPGGYRVVAELADQQRYYSFVVVDQTSPT